MAVNTEIGISEPVALRATVSITTRNIEPIEIDAGISLELLAPNKSLQI